jgi:nicotinamidase-related amidase
MITRAALLIVDVQNGFVNPNTAHIPKLVEQLQHDYANVFASQFYNEDGSFYRTLIKWDRLQKDTPDFDLAFDLRPGGERIEKPIYTCVTRDFLATLRHRSISEVHLCGIETDICVTKCAVDLFENGVVPFVLKDYCASKSGPDAHDWALATLARYIGRDQII